MRRDERRESASPPESNQERPCRLAPDAGLIRGPRAEQREHGRQEPSWMVEVRRGDKIENGSGDVDADADADQAPQQAL